MPDYIKNMLKQNSCADPSVEVNALDQKIHDADGIQLSQTTIDPPIGTTEWHELPQQPNLDLDLASTERRRAVRSRTLRKR